MKAHLVRINFHAMVNLRIKMGKNTWEILRMETLMVKDFIMKKTDLFMKEFFQITFIMVSGNIFGRMARIMKENINLAKIMEMGKTYNKMKLFLEKGKKVNLFKKTKIWMIQQTLKSRINEEFMYLFQVYDIFLISIFRYLLFIDDYRLACLKKAVIVNN